MLLSTLHFITSKAEDISLSCRNIVLQNELIDEDLEHFEDMLEDDEYTDNPKQNEMVESANAKSRAAVDIDADALPCEDGSAPSGSKGNVSDDANDLLLEGGQRELRGFKPITDGRGLASEVTTVRTTSPGGYSPRHREPLYWYSSVFCCLTFDALFKLDLLYFEAILILCFFSKCNWHKICQLGNMYSYSLYSARSEQRHKLFIVIVLLTVVLFLYYILQHDQSLFNDDLLFGLTVMRIVLAGGS